MNDHGLLNSLLRLGRIGQDCNVPSFWVGRVLAEVVQPTQLVPRRDGQPIGGVLVGVVETDAAREEEHPLRRDDLPLVLHARWCGSGLIATDEES